MDTVNNTTQVAEAAESEFKGSLAYTVKFQAAQGWGLVWSNYDIDKFNADLHIRGETGIGKDSTHLGHEFAFLVRQLNTWVRNSFIQQGSGGARL